MAEGILTRHGGGTPGLKVVSSVVTNIFTTNATFIVPNYEKSKGVSVRIFGGGGSTYLNSGGGGE